MAARLRDLGRVLLMSAACAVLPHAALAQSPDPLEGHIVREIQVTGLRNLSPQDVESHLATRVGEPFHAQNLVLDQRRLDALRLFTAVVLQPQLEGEEVVLQVTVTETLRLLPVVMIRVTDENGVSAGVGLRGINLLGRGTQASVSALFGGETSVGLTVDATTLTPGTWTRHFGFSYSSRRNTLYDFDERSTSADVRGARNVRHGLQIGGTVSVLAIDTGSSGEALSPDGNDVIPTLGAFITVDTLDSSTNPRAGTWAEVEVDRLVGDASSWSFILDGRRFQRLSKRHGLGMFSLATFQTGEIGVSVPDYLQFALGGANTVRGWSLGSRRGGNQFIGTLEYTYVIRPVTSFTVAHLNLYAGVQLVGFGDVGLAWGSGQPLKDASGIDGYGAGVRLLVPFVDVIRLDVGWGEPGRGATAYFSVSLKAARQRQRVR
jgi:outer membrane protein assembly factor BamA